MAETITDVVGGVDTHGDIHVAAVVDTCGRILDTVSFAATGARLPPPAELDATQGGGGPWRELAIRVTQLDAQVDRLDAVLEPLVRKTCPELLARVGVGPVTASALLVAAGDNPERLHHEAAFSALCGSSPIEASSGRVVRHRLNLGGDRRANSALWQIVLVRMRCDARTRTYVERRTQEGMSEEIMRCLKRYVAREVYQCISKTTALKPPF